MNNLFNDYLVLLNQMTEELKNLSELAKTKNLAAMDNDIMSLNEILKKEQVSALAFRGMESKQKSILQSLELTDVPLSSLVEHYPKEQRFEAKKVVENLQDAYKLYCCSSEVARNTLECNLHQIEKIISNIKPSVEGPGYEDKSPQLPKKMKTDFRA